MNIPCVLRESQFFSVRCSFDEPQARILPIVLQCLNGQPVPPALYVEHKLILREGLSLPAPLPACPGVLSEEALLVAG
jgi:hypothetical protein